MGSIETWLAIAGFVLTAGAQFGGLVWWLRGQIEGLRISQLQFRDEFKKNYVDDLDSLRREFGESVMAVRQKINDVELWTRDNLVSKTTFDLVTQRIEKGLEKLGDKIEDRLERLGERIENLKQ